MLLSISILSYSLAILTQRILMKGNKSDPVSYSVIFQLLTGFIIGIFGYLTADMTIPRVQPLLINLTLLTLLYGIGNIFTFKALKMLEASEFTIIFATRGLFTLIASSILLKEGLYSTQFLGALLILISVVLVTIKSMHLKFSRGELLALLGAMCMGFAVTNDRYLLSYFSVYPYVTIAFILPALFIGLLNFKKMKNVKTLFKKHIFIKMLVMCLLFSISSISFFSALKMGNNSSQIAILNLLSIILIVVLGTVFLRERNNILRKIIGSILSIIGSAILVK